jgi:hypothetical protein
MFYTLLGCRCCEHVPFGLGFGAHSIHVNSFAMDEGVLKSIFNYATTSLFDVIVKEVEAKQSPPHLP